MSLRDKDGPLYNTKQEPIGDTTKPIALASSNSSRLWSSAFKNPRIVRVSRTFGGKDRHSKVCTIKGLRDRRIRLSVPTAIQLYDLQDRLGVGQPSKVIDWLLDNTKHDIDKLPPLPIIPGCFDPSQGYGVPFSSSSSYFDASLLSSRKGGININSSIQESDIDEENQSLLAKLKYWNSNSMMRSKQKYQEQGSTSQVLAQNLFPIPNTSSNDDSTSMLHNNNANTTFLSNNSMFNYYHLEPSDISLSQLGSLGLPSSQSNSPHQPPSIPHSSVSQLFLCPPMATTSYFPQNQHSHGSSFMNSSHLPQHDDNEIRQLARFPLLNNHFSSSFHNSIDPHLQENEEENRQGKSVSHSLWKE